MKKVLSALATTALISLSGSAMAQQWSGSYQPTAPYRSSSLDNLGEEAQMVFGVDRVMGLSFDRMTTEPTGSTRTSKDTTFSLFGNGAGVTSFPRLAFDYFVMEGLSIGGSLVYWQRSGETEIEPDSGSSTTNDNPTRSLFAIAPRVGYAIPFDETFSFWPRAGVTYYNQKIEQEKTTAAGDKTTSSVSTSAWDLTLEGMFGISPMSHFAILIGPYLDLGLTGNTENDPGAGSDTVETDTTITSFGLAVSIVGYY